MELGPGPCALPAGAGAGSGSGGPCAEMLQVAEEAFRGGNFELAAEMDDELDGKLDRRTRLEYRDRGKFEAQLQIASDLLIF